MSKKTMLNCILTDWDSQTFKMEDVDPHAPSNVIKQVNQLHDLWMKANPVASTNVKFRANLDLFFDRLRRSAGIIDATTFDPAFFHKMESKALHGINRVLNGLNVNDGITSYLKNLDRKGKGYINNLFEKVELAKKAKVLKTQSDKVLKDVGITGARRDTVLYKLYETANLQYLIDYTGELHPTAQRVALRIQEANTDVLRKAGLSDYDIVDLTKYANDVVQTQYEIANVVKKAGVDLSDVLEDGYFKRLFSPEAKEMLDKILAKKVTPSGKVVDIDPRKWLQNSRNTNMLVFDDLDTIDYLFQRSNIFKRLNETADEGIKGWMKQYNLKEINSVRFMMEEGSENTLSHIFNNVFTPDELDFFVDSGLLSKIPVESGKIYENLIKHYELPFEGLNDVFITNPVQAASAYREILQRITTEHGRVYGMIRGASEKFGIPRDIALNSKEYKEFVSMRQAIPPKQWNKIEPEAQELLDNIFVHPRIAKVNYSDLLTASDPIRQGLIGQTLTFIRKTTAGTMLGTTQWMGRQIIGNTAYLESMGIHPHSYLGNITRKVWHDSKNVIKNGVDNFSASLDNTKKFGTNNKYSEKDLWKALERSGLIDTSTVFGSVNKTGVDFEGSFRRTLRQFEWMKKNYPDNVGGFVAQKGIDAANRGVDTTLFKYLGYGNELTDNMAKFTMLQQVMSHQRFTRIFDNDFLDSLPYKGDIKEALEFVRQHSFMFDDLPNDNNLYKGTASFVPFLSWRIKSAQQTARYLVEQPQKFASYLKIVGRYQDELKENHPVEYEGAIAPWMNNNSLIAPIRIDKEFTGTGKDEWFQNPLMTVIPQIGTLEEFNMFLDDLGMFQKGKRPSNRNENPHKKKTPMLRRMFNSEAAPLLKGLATVFTGTTEFDRDYQNLTESTKKRDLFGVEVSNIAYYWMTTALPSLKGINKVFSYTGLSAEAPEFDLTTGRWTQGKKSWLGGETDYPSRSQQESVLSNVAGLAEVIGANPMPINVYWNMGYYSRKDIEAQLKGTQNSIKALNKKMSLARDAEEAAKLKQDTLNLITYDVMLRSELGIIVRWANKNNIPYHKAVDRIVQRNMQISDLLPREEVQRIAEENYKMWIDNPYIR